MASNKQWLPFHDALELVEQIFLELRTKVPLEHFVELCSKEYRSDLMRPDSGSLIYVALLSAACGSGSVRARSYYAPRKHEPIPTEFWRTLDLNFWWMDIVEDDEINVPDLRQWFTDRFSRPRRRGRSPKVDWDGYVKNEFFALLDYHGLPDPGDPQWRNQADAETALAKICGISLSESVIRERTSRFISEWLRKKAGN